MGKPTAPEQIQIVAKKIQSPISKYPKEQSHSHQHESYSKQPPSDAYRQRNTRSQGDYIGLLPPEVPSTTNAVKERKVKISQQIKVRTGSHESMRVPPTDGQTVRGGLDGGNRAGSKYNVRKAHAGEAAGGLLMMRRDDSDDRVPQASTSTTKRTMAGAFKRRSNNNVVKP